MVDAAGMAMDRCQCMDRGNAAEKTVWNAVSGGAWHCLLTRLARRQGVRQHVHCQILLAVPYVGTPSSNYRGMGGIGPEPDPSGGGLPAVAHRAMYVAHVRHLPTRASGLYLLGHPVVHVVAHEQLCAYRTSEAVRGDPEFSGKTAGIKPRGLMFGEQPAYSCGSQAFGAGCEGLQAYREKIGNKIQAADAARAHASIVFRRVG